MAEHTIKMPDVGEGVAEAELVEWNVKIGDPVREDMVLAAVMTDKATVEIPSPVEGEISWLGAEIGEVVAVGAPLIRIKSATLAIYGSGYAWRASALNRSRRSFATGSASWRPAGKMKRPALPPPPGARPVHGLNCLNLFDPNS